METEQIPPERILKAMNHSICQRAVLMHTLLTGYSLFDSIQVKKRCTNVKLTYKDAEFIANKYEEITGIDMSPTDVLFDGNELANQLLDDYQELQRLMNTAFNETLSPMVNAYYYHLFFYRKVDSTVIQTALIALTAFLNYAYGNIDKKELKNNIIGMDLINKKTFVIDSMYVRHNLINLEKDFNDICVKKANREMKKSGKAYDNFTIDISM